MREGETPVPIPNTKVKTLAADDTRAATPRESRRLPDFFIKEKLQDRDGQRAGSTPGYPIGRREAFRTYLENRKPRKTTRSLW